MSPTREAACSCGQLRVVTTGEPVRISMCHCLACQRRTGSAFGAQVRFAPSQCRFEGRSKTFERIGDSGGKATFHFCPECGATVHWSIDKMPETVAVAIGAFDDPAGLPAPTVSIYETRRLPWVTTPEGAERYD
jgi:hypothetical protein